uniref:CX domain-containing protein n=1 Tax=Acrobeloides nanus TaxID=290746 RepID=A0A914BU76_9BILA
MGRGSSSARSSSTGSGGSRSSGGIFGGSSGKTGGSSSIGRGGSSSSGGIFGGSSGKTGGGIFGGSSGRNTGGGIFGGSSGRNTGGGIFGSNSGRNTGRGIFGGSSGRNTGGGIFGGSSGQNRGGTTTKIPTTTTTKNAYSGGNSGWESGGHKYTKGSGVGSFVRSNTFKNAIVDATAGHLIYQDGKHMIQNATAPMMWSNRQYYWGEQYYQSRPGNQMCRMPIDPTDQHFANVYFQNQTRPREIVWGCGACEVCCGTECCHVNDEFGWENCVFGLLYAALTPDASNLPMLV